MSKRLITLPESSAGNDLAHLAKILHAARKLEVAARTVLDAQRGHVITAETFDILADALARLEDLT
jgi:hypothetical protein